MYQDTFPWKSTKKVPYNVIVIMTMLVPVMDYHLILVSPVPSLQEALGKVNKQPKHRLMDDYAAPALTNAIEAFKKRKRNGRLCTIMCSHLGLPWRQDRGVSGFDQAGLDRDVAKTQLIQCCMQDCLSPVGCGFRSQEDLSCVLR